VFVGKGFPPRRVKEICKPAILIVVYQIKAMWHTTLSSADTKNDATAVNDKAGADFFQPVHPGDITKQHSKKMREPIIASPAAAIVAMRSNRAGGPPGDQKELPFCSRASHPLLRL